MCFLCQYQVLLYTAPPPLDEVWASPQFNSMHVSDKFNQYIGTPPN